MSLQNDVENQQLHERRRRGKNPNRIRLLMVKIVVYALVLSLAGWAWYTIVVKGYTQAKTYIDASIEQVRVENAMNIKEVEDKVDLLSNDLRNLRESLELTDSSITDSTQVQKEIDTKLQNLDRQLKELERTLNILKEAPNAN